VITDKRFAAHLKEVNRLLKGASAPGAYALGLLSSRALTEGWLPTPREMVRLTECETICQAETLVHGLSTRKTVRKKPRRPTE